MTARRGLVVFALATALAMGVAATAPAAVTIVEGQGVGAARLGMRDKTAASKLGKVTKSGRDTSYAGRVVYRFCFGAKMSNGRYPLEMFSDKEHKVFTFAANSASYVTRKGIKVGSAESALTRAYGSSLRKYPGSVYTRYTIGSRPATDFYVRSKKVARIIVRAR